MDFSAQSRLVSRADNYRNRIRRRATAAQTAQARAVYNGSIASYRETVLTALRQVEDKIAALRILQGEPQVQDDAVKAAQPTVVVTTNQYRASMVSYLNVIVTQAAGTAIKILGKRLNASVLLIKALGGGWNT